MLSYYRIVGLPGLDGLIVGGEEILMTDEMDQQRTFVDVKELINSNVIVGDRQVKFPILGGLMIENDHLESVDYSPREWTTKNPFGKLQYEGHWNKGTIHVDYALYDNGMSVNVKDTSVEPPRTVFSNNFFGEFCEDAENCIHDVFNDERDVDELVFELNQLIDTQKTMNP